MDDLQMQLLIDLHRSNFRQGPGGKTETKKALMLAGLDKSRPLTIADIGCGTGASTIQLAKELDAKITAVDLLPEFLEELQTRTKAHGVADKITTLSCSMDVLPFADEEFDVIWSEGAIYIMGFEKGINEWQKFLKPGGYIAISEICWITNDRPQEIQDYWQNNYAEIDTIANKIRRLEKAGFSPSAHFILSENCWLDNYYIPLQARHEEFLKKHHRKPKVQEIIDMEKQEFNFYKKYKDYFSYGFFIAKKLSP